MKIELVTGGSIFESCKNAIRTIDSKDLSTDFFVVVPDRFTLQAEDIIFDVLDIQSTFNINVIGLSGFAIKFLNAEGIEIDPITQTESVLIIKDILEENKGKMTFYKKNNPYFCNEVAKIIRQLKSSLLKPEEIKYDGDRVSLGKKIKDIALIYREYEQRVAGRIDTTDLLNKFVEVADNTTYFDNAEVIFAGFDSFSSSNYAVIKECVKKAKKVSISIPQALGVGNSYIYEKDITDKVKKLVKDLDVEIEVLSPVSQMNENQLVIAKNLYQVNDVVESDYLYLSTSPNKKEEVESVANLIKYATFKGKRYKNFTVACNLTKYADEIERAFNKRGIPYYLDSSSTCENSPIIKLIKKIFDLKLKNFINTDLLYVLDSQLLDIEDREEKIVFCNEKKIEGKDFFKYVRNGLLNKYIKEIDNAKRTSDFVEIVQEIIADTNKNYQSYIEGLEKKGFLKEKNIEEQTVAFLEKGLSFIKKDNKETTLKDFIALFDLIISFQEISALPTYCDCVFVGDITESYFCENDTIFVLGANGGQVPVVVADCGLLTDKDLSNVQLSRKIEPTIKMINRRNRFRLFNLVSLAQNRLIVSFLNQDEDGSVIDKASFVQDLMKMFKKTDKDIVSTSANIDEDENFERFLLSLGGARNTASLKFYEILSKEKKGKAVGSLQEVLKNDFSKMKLNRERLASDCKEVYFPKNKFRVTQIESGFYICPFKHFISYGLRLKEKEKPELQANELGSFYHAIFERFVKENKNNLSDVTNEKINIFLKRSIPEVLDQERVEFIKNKELEIKYLYSNSRKLCQRIITESQKSSFKPFEIEAMVEDNTSFTCQNQPITMRGKVDRVDVYKDGFRIIDYKTGKITSNLLTDAYYGIKLQLFLYSKAIARNGLKPLGVYYFDAKITYEKSKGLLRGKTIGEEAVRGSDKRFFDLSFKKSDIIQARRSSRGELVYEGLTEEEFATWQKYSVEMTQRAIDEITNGEISPRPTETACEFCSYRGICLYDAKRGSRKLNALKEEE